MLLKNYREKLGWTQKKLSQVSGVSQTYISELEAGKFQPTIKILKKLSSALGVSITELLKEQEEEQNDTPQAV